jgi:hypothetical protein
MNRERRITLFDRLHGGGTLFRRQARERLHYESRECEKDTGDQPAADRRTDQADEYQKRHWFLPMRTAIGSLIITATASRDATNHVLARLPVIAAPINGAVIPRKHLLTPRKRALHGRA